MRRSGQSSRVVLFVRIRVRAIIRDWPLTSVSIFFSLSLSLHIFCLFCFSPLSYVLTRFGTSCAPSFCANDRAADIGNYSLRNSRARLLPVLFFLSMLSSSPIVLVAFLSQLPLVLLYLLLSAYFNSRFAIL